MVCNDIGMKVHAEKSNLSCKKVTFCWSIISADCIRYHPHHFDSLDSMRRTTKAGELQSLFARLIRCETQFLHSPRGYHHFINHWTNSTGKKVIVRRRVFSTLLSTTHGAPTMMPHSKTSKHNSLSLWNFLILSPTTAYVYSRMLLTPTGQQFWRKWRTSNSTKALKNRTTNRFVLSLEMFRVIYELVCTWERRLRDCWIYKQIGLLGHGARNYYLYLSRKPCIDLRPLWEKPSNFTPYC